MIRDKKDGGIFSLAGRLQCIENAPQFVIEIGNHAVVGVPRGTHVILCDAVAMATMSKEQRLRMIVEILERQGTNRRQVDVLGRITAPIFV